MHVYTTNVATPMERHGSGVGYKRVLAGFLVMAALCFYSLFYETIPVGPCRTNYRIMQRADGTDNHRPFIVDKNSACQPCRRGNGGLFGSPIAVAASLGDIGALKAILDAGADPNERFGDTTPLHSLADCGDAAAARECAELLFLHGTVAGSRDNIGSTPLHYAAMRLRPEFTSFLIDQGANVNAVDDLGNTPLHVMASFATIEKKEASRGSSDARFPKQDRFKETFLKLLDAGAAIAQKNDRGETIFDICASGTEKRRLFDEALRDR